MANLFNDEMMEVEELFLGDTSSMKARHIEAAKRDYLNYPQAKDLWDSDFIEECLRASLTPSPSV